MKKTIILTGCAGFIGANFLKTIAMQDKVIQEYNFIVLDALTYAGMIESIKLEISLSHISFYSIDLRNAELVAAIFQENKIDGVIHFAAESHVDRSINNPNIFVETNVLGTLNLLNESLKSFNKNSNFRYLQVSTDEVYGSLELQANAFTEASPLQPTSPYSASKASADMLVEAFHKTYGLPTVITRCSNNYGPYQFPEKLIPLMIYNAQRDISLPVYGDGKNVRDWIFVDDHNQGIWLAYVNGQAGSIYNLGGDSEFTNIEIVKLILKILGKSEKLITMVDDRLGHDLRYAINFSKAKKELGWQPKVKIEEGLKRTIEWYIKNNGWIDLTRKRAN